MLMTRVAAGTEGLPRCGGRICHGGRVDGCFSWRGRGTMRLPRRGGERPTGLLSGRDNGGRRWGDRSRGGSRGGSGGGSRRLPCWRRGGRAGADRARPGVRGPVVWAQRAGEEGRMGIGWGTARPWGRARLRKRAHRWGTGRRGTRAHLRRRARRWGTGRRGTRARGGGSGRRAGAERESVRA